MGLFPILVAYLAQGSTSAVAAGESVFVYSRLLKERPCAG